MFANTRIDLPTPTRILLGINQFFTDYWQVAIFGIVFLVIAIWRILQTKSGRFQWHKILLDLPVFGPIAQKMAISRFCHVLDTLDRTGVPILDSLEIAGKTQEMHLLKIGFLKYIRMCKWKKVAVSINTHTFDIFSNHVLKMIQVGEEAGAMDDMLRNRGYDRCRNPR